MPSAAPAAQFTLPLRLVLCPQRSLIPRPVDFASHHQQYLPHLPSPPLRLPLEHNRLSFAFLHNTSLVPTASASRIVIQRTGPSPLHPHCFRLSLLPLVSTRRPRQSPPALRVHRFCPFTAAFCSCLSSLSVQSPGTCRPIQLSRPPTTAPFSTPALSRASTRLRHSCFRILPGVVSLFADPACQALRDVVSNGKISSLPRTCWTITALPDYRVAGIGNHQESSEPPRGQLLHLSLHAFRLESSSSLDQSRASRRPGCVAPS
jgi:hypothetical protein